MENSLDADSLLYLVGGFLGIIAVAVFSLENVLGLSPVTKSLVLGLSFAFFLPLGLNLEDRILEKIMYGLSIASFLGLVNYINTMFDGMSFVIFSLSSLILMGLGYLTREGRFQVGRQDLRIYLGITLLVGFSLAMFDISAGQVGQSLVLDNSTSIEGGHAGVGSLVVTNDFMLPREFEAPGYSACIYGPQGEMFTVPVELDSPDMIAGNKLVQLDLWINVPRDFNAGEVTVKKAESCSVGFNNTVLIVEDALGRL